MSARAIELELEPQEHKTAAEALKIETYTYDADKVPYDVMAERVTLGIDTACMRVMVHLTPDEARVLANQLLQVADQADEARARRESFEQISDEMRDADELGGPGCYYAHPDVHYVPADQVATKVRELKAAGCRRFMVLRDDSNQEAVAA